MINRENMLKLADYLDRLPEDYEHFDMTEWIRSKESNTLIRDYAINNGGVSNCGTVACAIGHGPAAGVLFDGDDVELWWLTGKPNWYGYTEKMFTDEAHVFDWCFDSRWGAYDNTPSGAANRIRQAVTGKIPGDFSGSVDQWNTFHDNTQSVRFA